jgi:hypothetical protein
VVPLKLHHARGMSFLVSHAPSFGAFLVGNAAAMFDEGGNAQESGNADNEPEHPPEGAGESVDNHQCDDYPDDELHGNLLSG